MANRRMFAKSITGSARFLRMPMSARLLYYDLGMQADDEGVVEAFTVMRMTGASEDDLRVLAAKEFVQVLNEDLVTLIADWKTNNIIRTDRFAESLYHDLITGELKEISWKPMVNQRETTGLPSDNRWETQVRLGKESIVKDSIGEDDEGQSIIGNHINGYVSSFINLSPTAMEELTSFREDDKIPDDVIRYAVDFAIDNNKRTWSYVRAILKAFVDKGFKTLADVKQAEADRDKQKNSLSAKQAKNSKADLNYQQHEYTDADFTAPIRTAEEEEAAYKQAMLKYMGGVSQ